MIFHRIWRFSVEFDDFPVVRKLKALAEGEFAVSLSPGFRVAVVKEVELQFRRHERLDTDGRGPFDLPAKDVARSHGNRFAAVLVETVAKYDGRPIQPCSASQGSEIGNGMLDGQKKIFIIIGNIEIII